MVPAQRQPVPDAKDALLHAYVPSGVDKEHCGVVRQAQDNIVTVDFKRWTSPFFPVAQEIAVTFRSNEMFRPFVARSRVILREDQDSHLRYKLCFGEQDGQSIRVLFRPRASLRIVPEKLCPIKVRDAMESSSTILKAHLRDISLQGVSFWVDPTSELQLSSACRMKMLVQLPGEPNKLELIADVRYRRLVDDQVQIGLAFRWSEFKHDKVVRQCLDAYIQRRKREIRERALGLDSNR
jgi:hypothetical protein